MLVVRTELVPIAGSPVMWGPEVAPAAEVGVAVRSAAAEARCERLERLLERHEASLYDYLYRLTGSGTEAGRLTRDALLRASQDGASQPGRSTEGEERRVAIRLFAVATAGVLGPGRLRSLWGPLQRCLPRPRRAPATDAPDVPDLLAVLESLSAPQRACILLREHHDLSYDEIAEVLGTCRGEVATLLAGARDALRTRGARCGGVYCCPAGMARPEGRAASSIMSQLTVLNPTGFPPQVTGKAMAPRLDTLDGKTVYLVDCRFDDLDLFLKQMQGWFSEHLPAVQTRFIQIRNVYTKDDPETWEEVKRGGDAAIIGVGH